jgi:transcriptional regulator with XRE-family HTH domain
MTQQIQIEVTGEMKKGTAVPPELTAMITAELNRRGWTWKRLATETGKSHATMYDIRDGRRVPEINTLQAVTQALGLDEDAVLRAANIKLEGRKEDPLVVRLKAALGRTPKSKQGILVSMVEGAADQLARDD